MLMVQFISEHKLQLIYSVSILYILLEFKKYTLISNKGVPNFYNLCSTYNDMTYYYEAS